MEPTMALDYDETVVTIRDIAFEEDLRFITDLINSKFYDSTFSNAAFQSTFESTLRRYLLLIWAIEAHSPCC